MPDAPATVLIVDDEPSLLRMMSAYLKRLGFEVICFGSAEQAWQYAESDTRSISVAVVDLTIQGMSALELGNRLLTANPRLHLVVASGYPAPLEDFEKAGPGRVSFLHKPFSPEMLAAQVRTAVG